MSQQYIWFKTNPLNLLNFIILGETTESEQVEGRSDSIPYLTIASDGNRSHFQDRWSLYQQRLMIDHLWQLPTKCIYWL